MKKSLYIVYYYTSEQEKDFECIVFDSGKNNEAGIAWQKRFYEEYEQKISDDDIVGVYEITNEGNYKIIVKE